MALVIKYALLIFITVVSIVFTCDMIFRCYYNRRLEFLGKICLSIEKSLKSMKDSKEEDQQ